MGVTIHVHLLAEHLLLRHLQNTRVHSLSARHRCGECTRSTSPARHTSEVHQAGTTPGIKSALRAGQPAQPHKLSIVRTSFTSMSLHMSHPRVG